jgi:hypothetical protein
MRENVPKGPNFRVEVAKHTSPLIWFSHELALLLFVRLFVQVAIIKLPTPHMGLGVVAAIKIG